MSLSDKKPTIGIIATRELKGNMVTMLENLGELIGDKYTLVLVTGVDPKRPKLAANFDIQLLSSSHGDEGHGIKYAYDITRQYLAQSRPDILMNAGHPLPLGVAVASTGSKHSVRTVIRVTGDIFGESQRAANLSGKLRKWFIYNVWMTSLLRKATGIMALGSRTERLLQSKRMKGHVKLLRQPFKPELFKALDDDAKQAMKRSIGLDPAKKTILYVGSLSRGKGTDRLLNIFKEVSAQTSAYQLCLVGDGPLSPPDKSGISGEVIAPGRVNRDDVSGYFQCADVFVYPTRSDALPNVLLEAVSCGVPILSTDIGEISSVVQYGLTAETDFATRILNGDYRPEEIPEWYDWEYQRKEYIEFFERVLN